jgi:hypothetical protein
MANIPIILNANEKEIEFDLYSGIIPQKKPLIEKIRRLGAASVYSQVLGNTSETTTIMLYKYFTTYTACETFGKDITDLIGYVGTIKSNIEDQKVFNIIILDAKYSIQACNNNFDLVNPKNFVAIIELTMEGA